MSDSNTEEIIYNNSPNTENNTENDIPTLPQGQMTILTIPLSIRQHLFIQQIYGMVGYNAYIQYLINNAERNGIFDFIGARRIAQQVHDEELANQIQQFRNAERLERHILRPPLKNITQFIKQNGRGNIKKSKKKTKKTKNKKTKNILISVG